jgi:hypothetical protein
MPTHAMTDDVHAAVAAKTELGEAYEAALADSLLERFDAQAGRREPSLAHDAVTVIIALGSIGLGVVFALVAQNLGELGGTLATIVAWIGIAVVNVAHARTRGPR